MTAGGPFQPAWSCGSTTPKPRSKPSPEHGKVRGSKMTKCCLVLVQSNKSFLIEVTLHMDQVCRKICKVQQWGSEQMLKPGVLCLLGGVIAKSMYIYKRYLTCCGRAVMVLRWCRRQIRSVSCHFFLQIHWVKHSGELCVSSYFFDNYTGKREALQNTYRKHVTDPWVEKLHFPLCNCTAPGQSHVSDQGSWTKQCDLHQSALFTIKPQGSPFCYNK